MTTEAFVTQPGIRHSIPAFKTLSQMLLNRYQSHREEIAFTWLERGDVANACCITYGELYRDVAHLGQYLIDRGYSGKRILILFPPGLEYIKAFFAAVWAGAQAVPIYPPKGARYLDRFRYVLQDCQAPAALMSEEIRKALEPQVRALEQNLVCIAVDPVLNAPDRSVPDGLIHEPEPEEVALIQYTSGSTSDPKGVLLSHANLLHNQAMIRHTFDHNRETLVCGWLPLYHDMGLIGNIMQPIYTGCHCILMSPVSFIKNPANWLKAISHFRVTTSGGPNFSYALCTEEISDDVLETLDLSSWKVAFNGAEPINHKTLEKFYDRFKSAGFRKEAFLPCYGLAEASLIVTGKPARRPYRCLDLDDAALKEGRVKTFNQDVLLSAATQASVKRLVGSGYPCQGCDVRIVNPDNLSVCEEGVTGEIWVKSPSLSSGYWRKDALNKVSFNQQLPANTLAHLTGYFRTGDLGFLYQEELFITGRLKELMIINGKNIYPQDIEWLVESGFSEIHPGGSAAFHVKEEETTGRVVLLCELKQESMGLSACTLTQLRSAILRSIQMDLELAVQDLVFVKPYTLPKTSSGKMQRTKCKSLYLIDQLEIILGHYKDDSKKK